MTSRLLALFLISLLCPLLHAFSAYLPKTSCSPPDLAALHSLAAAFPPPLFTAWQLAATRNDCCGHWGALTINCSSCFAPTANSTAVGRVTGLAIDLMAHDVQGIGPVTIPVAICGLSALTSLRLIGYNGNTGNLISGPVPECIGNNLTHLVHLDLSSNSLTGSIPLSFSRLSSLQYLDLSSNSLSGAFPPLNSSHLTSLNLNFNSFSGSIPSPLNLTHLTSLSLYANSLSGPLPILNTPNLVSVGFSYNYISGSLSPLFHASNLTSLLSISISNNQLKGAIPDFDPFHISPLLSGIDFSSNLLSGSLPQSICGFTNLSGLDLSSNAFSGHMNILEKCNFSNLGSLDLSTNLFTGPFPDWSRSPSQLNVLSRAHNSLRGSLPKGWQNLTLLFYVDLSGNSVLVPPENPTAPKLPCWLFELSNLQELYLSSMQLRTADLVGICSSGHCAHMGGGSLHLDVLDLSNNLLNASILSCLSLVAVFDPLKLAFHPTFYGREGPEPALNLSGNPLKLDLSNPDVVKLLPKSVKTLDLSACLLRGHLTKLFFGRLAPSLTYLYFAHNHLEGQIPGELGNMSHLEGVDLSYNFFTGLSPLTNGGLMGFDLYLSNNNLTGNLSSLISQIAPNMSLSIDEGDYIYDLDLSHNFLSGDIPPKLFQCLSDVFTQRLKLNHNNLDGSLPNVPFPPSLTALSLNNNQLSGQIPSSFRILPSLLLLDLSHNKLEGDLQTIAFFRNASLGHQFPKLRVLLMGSNNFTGAIPASLGDIAPALQLIDLSNNHLTGSVPVHALQSLPAFKKLYFPAVAIIGDLDVKGGTLYEEISINVKGREETYSYVLQALTSLDLSNNKLSGPIPVGLGELSGLVYLNLSRNKLTGHLPSDLGMLGGQLQALDLSFNEFVGPIPSTFTNLTALAVFNVSYNEGLSGSILQTPQFENKDSYIGDPKLCSSAIGQEPILPNACSNLLHGGDPTTSSQEEPHKSIDSFKRWINEWIDIRGFSLCTVVGFLGTLWALRALFRR